ncbi:hypothetical protein [Ottowia sp.]|uniref:hypothetical protein n=1 Tax=Ottowia sp. TaxID=1898956 RepID=UPI003A85870F
MRSRSQFALNTIFAALTLFAAQISWSQAVIQSGDVQIGVRQDGALNVANPAGGAPVGITYIPTGADALIPGCWCEAWGVADAVSGRYGSTGAATGTQNIVVESFSSTATSATSVTRVEDISGPLFRVTQAFTPSSEAGVFHVAVTVENISGASTTLLYRRAMDWDISPDTFNELVTLQAGTSPQITFTSDDGFANGNPLTGPSSILFTGSATDSGPEDHGALFDFNFGTLAAGASRTFSIYYGATANRADAMTALTSLGVEAYSLGMPNNPAGSPNTYLFAFAGVGGAPIGGSATTVPVPVNHPFALIALFAALAGASRRALRKKYPANNAK